MKGFSSAGGSKCVGGPVSSRGFRELIRRVLHETGLAPQYLELELTESLLLANADVMFSVLQELKAMGLTLAIDDFGTGYSSLSYLKTFSGQQAQNRPFVCSRCCRES